MQREAGTNLFKDSWGTAFEFVDETSFCDAKWEDQYVRLGKKQVHKVGVAVCWVQTLAKTFIRDETQSSIDEIFQI